MLRLWGFAGAFRLSHLGPFGGWFRLAASNFPEGLLRRTINRPMFNAIA